MKNDLTEQFLAKLSRVDKLPEDTYSLTLDGEEFEFHWRYNVLLTNKLKTVSDWLDFIASHLVDPSRIDDLTDALTTEATSRNIDDQQALIALAAMMAEAVGQRPKASAKRSRASGKDTETT